jgi:hypothetical protein
MAAAVVRATRKRNAARRKGYARGKGADGSTSVENTRRRLQWLAHVWQIPTEDLPKIGNSISMVPVVNFAEKYDVRLD